MMNLLWLIFAVSACSGVPAKTDKTNEAKSSEGSRNRSGSDDEDVPLEDDSDLKEQVRSEGAETSVEATADPIPPVESESPSPEASPTDAPIASPSPSPSPSLVPSRIGAAYGGSLMTAYISDDSKLYLSGGVNTALGLTSDRVCASLNLARCEPRPKLVSDTQKFSAVSFANGFGQHVLAVGTDGFAYAWGSNTYGEVAFDVTQKPTTPTRVTGPVNIVAVAANRNYSLAVDKDGGVWEWGADWMRITNGSIVPDKRIGPRKLAGLPAASSVYGRGGASFALTKDGKVYQWGQVSSRRVAFVEVIDRIPKEVPGLSEVIDLEISDQYLAVTKTGSVYSWGYGGLGSLGHGDMLDRSAPTKIEGLNDVVEVFSQDQTSFAITKAGAMYVWGAYRYTHPPVEGAVNCGNQKCLLKPTLVPNFPALQKLSCGSLHCVGYSPERKRWVGFGNRYMGVFGNGAYDDLFVGVTDLGNL
jgi:alpha-tubulin suppressor-like RCC1 family protein